MKKLCTLTIILMSIPGWAAFTVDRAVMSSEYWEVWNDDVQQKIDADIDKHRRADGSFLIAAADGTEVKVEQLTHDFYFGGQIFNFGQLGKKEWNDRYQALFAAEGGLFNSGTVPFYWRTLERYPNALRFEERYEDTEEFWADRKNPEKEPHWRRPAVDPVISFLKTRGCRVHGHPLVWGNNGGMFPTWIWDDFCPEDEKVALEEASGEKLQLRDVTLPMGVKDMKTGSCEWQVAWAKIYSLLSEEEIAALVPTFLKRQEEIYEKRIRDIGERYAERVDSWDVVNESATDYDKFGRKALRKKAFDASWYGPMPADYALKAFLWAQKYLSRKSKFSINEYDMEPFFDQVKDLTANGARIDMVGVQMHLFNPKESAAIAEGKFSREVYSKTHPKAIAERFQKLAEAGRPIHLSEITITAPDLTEKGQMIQAIILRNLYRIWFSVPKMNGITWWNIVDGCGYPGEPAMSGLFTRDMKPKTAYYALDDLINREWKTNVSIPVNNGRASFRGFCGRYRLSWKCGVCGERHSRLVRLGKGGLHEVGKAKVANDCMVPVKNYIVDGKAHVLPEGKKYIDLKAIYPEAVVKWQSGVKWADVVARLTAPQDGEYTIFRLNDYWGEVFVNDEKIGSFHGPEIKPGRMKLKLRKGLNVIRHRTRAGSGGNWKCAILIPTDSPLKSL